MKRTLFAFVYLLITVTFCGCANVHVDVPLVWKPTNVLYDTDSSTLTSFSSHKYKIAAFADNRENKKEIARNVESSEPNLVTTRDDVAEWCRSRFKIIAKENGFNVVEDNANIIIKGEILQFYVTEDNLYKADVGVKITVEDAGDKVIWQGLMAGHAKKFGHSYKLENYYETLSDAYQDSVNGLLKNQEFRAALR